MDDPALSFFSDFRARLAGKPARLAALISTRAILRVLPVTALGTTSSSQNPISDLVDVTSRCAVASWLLAIGAWRLGDGPLEAIHNSVKSTLRRVHPSYSTITIVPIVDPLRANWPVPRGKDDADVRVKLAGAFLQVIGQGRRLLANKACDERSCRDGVQMAYEGLPLWNCDTAVLDVLSESEYSDRYSRFREGYCSEIIADLEVLKKLESSTAENWDGDVPIEIQAFVAQLQSDLLREPLFREDSDFHSQIVVCNERNLSLAVGQTHDRKQERMWARTKPIWQWWSGLALGGAAIDRLAAVFSSFEPDVWTPHDRFLVLLEAAWKRRMVPD